MSRFDRFFVFTGAVLIVSGIAQLLVRPRAARETVLQRLVNRATIQMLVFVVVGALGVLLGLGLLPIRLRMP